MWRSSSCISSHFDTQSPVEVTSNEAFEAPTESFYLPSFLSGLSTSTQNVSVVSAAIIPHLLNSRRETWCWQSQFNFKWTPGCLTTHHRRLILISRHGQMSREIAVLRGKSEHLSSVMTIVLIGKINKIPYLMGTSELKGSLVLPLFISTLNTMVN